MRIQFSLTCQRGTIIPINYQSELSNWIFSVLAKSGSEMNLWASQNGFDLGSRTFKLFSFSPLAIYPYEMDQVRQEFKLLGNQVKLSIALWLPQQFEQQIIHLFRQMPLTLGTLEGKSAEFEVKHWQVLPKPNFKDTQGFKVASPISVTHVEEGKAANLYPMPDSEEYDLAFFTHLLRRYKAGMNNRPLNSEGLLDPSYPLNIRVLSQPKSRLIHLKPNTEGLTQLRGFSFDFEVTMPQNLMDFVFSSGFGEHGHLGFGFVELMEPAGPLRVIRKPPMGGGGQGGGHHVVHRPPQLG